MNNPYRMIAEKHVNSFRSSIPKTQAQDDPKPVNWKKVYDKVRTVKELREKQDKQANYTNRASGHPQAIRKLVDQYYARYSGGDD